MTKQYKLILLDVDGTLVADYNSHELLPDVVAKLATCEGANFALVSNQGGVDLRHWMMQGGFGDPSQYPTEVEADRRIKNIANQLMLRLSEHWCAYYVAFAYQSKKSGNWASTPDDRWEDLRWRWDWRKPDTGMLQQAAHDACVDKSDVLMVGDRGEDKQAAQTFGIDFMNADEFFGRKGGD